MHAHWNRMRSASGPARGAKIGDMRDHDAPIEPATLARAIVGRNLTHATLGAELGPRAMALVFLRHYG